VALLKLKLKIGIGIKYKEKSEGLRLYDTNCRGQNKGSKREVPGV
jgi:hypothetical protein